jgi:flotillin
VDGGGGEADAKRVKLAAAEAEQVRLRAGAQAESVRAVGEAEAAAIQARGLAEGESVRARGMAEAETIKARADALAENQDAVIGQQLAENWPAIVEAAAKPFGSVDQMIVLNGAERLSEVLAQAMSQGVAGLQMARQILGHQGKQSDNGASSTDGERSRRGT